MTRDPRDTSAEEPDGGNLQVRFRRGPGSGNRPGLLNKSKAKMLRSHRDLILNYFRAKKEYFSAVVEGLNTKVKLVTRKAFGYRKAETIKTALFHALGRLPEPHHAHRFA